MNMIHKRMTNVGVVHVANAAMGQLLKFRANP